MTDREIEQLEKDARRPNRGAKYYPQSVVLALIEELKKAREELRVKQEGMFEKSTTPAPIAASGERGI